MILHYAGGKWFSAIRKSACVHLAYKACQEERRGVAFIREWRTQQTGFEVFALRKLPQLTQMTGDALICVDPGQVPRTTQRARHHRLHSI